MYGPSDENDVSLIENTGVTFQPKEIKNGEIVDTYDRNRRKKREKSKDELDPTLIGLVKKSKKKIKPGYKKKIDRAISESNKQKRRQARRQEERSVRKNKKRSNS